ncbi:MAG TPA: DUF2059 domain-containing protein [Sphingomonas sp.]|nr:DUF2059 domain-containing protein [Sphingomonas sp.]
MIKAFAMSSAALLLATPAVAQTAPTATETATTPIDPAVLDEARQVVGHLMPPGVYKKVMGSVMTPIVDSMGASMKALPLKELAQLGGLSADKAAALDKVDIEQVMAIYDPHWQERQQLTMRAMFDSMGEFLTSLEPELREAMAHAYANHFTLGELTDLNRFFSTPSGAKFASQYMTITSDPAMVAEMKSMMPKMMQHMPQFVDAAQKATADLPPPRKLEDLSQDEKARIAAALGVDETDLQDPKTTL